VSVLTLADAKADLGITENTFDAPLQAKIDSAEAVITKKCGPLAPIAKTNIVDGRGQTLVLPITPVISLTSVVGSTGDTIAVGDLFLVPPGLVSYNMYGLLSPGYWFFPSRYYTVVYQAGRTTCPADLLEAVRELTRHLWLTQRGGVSRREGPVDATLARVPGAGYLLPFSVQELIADHLQGGIA